MMSSTCAASSWGTLASTAPMIRDDRSSGRHSIREPLFARPIGVRAVETMTASGMEGTLPRTLWRPSTRKYHHLVSLAAHLAEHHRSQRAGWLRAAVLGANDGIVSIAGLVIGVAAADPTHTALVTAGLAGLVAGAMSMAAGEYISVSSQRDAEEADLRVEAEAIEQHRMSELHELARIYEGRGVEPGLARLVAEQLMAHDAVGAHARDELGINEISTARPLQAAWTSALA